MSYLRHAQRRSDPLPCRDKLIHNETEETVIIPVAMLDEQVGEIHTSILHRHMQRGRPIPVLDCRVRTVLDEQASKIHVSLPYRQMQRRRPTIVPRLYVRAVFNQEECEKHA